MSKQFEFADFINEFKVAFTAIQITEGHWNDSGDWLEGTETPVPMEGIILPLTEDDLQYSESGTFSVKDKKIYTLLPLEEGQKIEYKGRQYTIQNFKDYSDYSDVHIYFGRWREK